jgi:hypothetical protein
MSQEICQHCRHYHVPPAKAYAGVNVPIEDVRLCMRHPRTIMITPLNYCGEFEPKTIKVKLNYTGPEEPRIFNDD